MANNIVFQNQAEQLKSAVYGYDGSNYKALSVTASGALNIAAGTIAEIAEVSSIKGGTISTVSTVTSVTDVQELGSITGGTVTDVLELGSIKGGTITTVSTVTSVTDVQELLSIVSGTLATVTSVTDVQELGSLKGGTVTSVTDVQELLSIVSGTLATVTSVTDVQELGSITGGTITTVSTVTSVTDVQELLSLKGGTVNATIASRGFAESTSYVAPAANGTITSAYIDISRYQDTSWYIRNVSAVTTIVSVQIAITPTTADPYVLIGETATVKNDAKAITNAKYMKLAKIYLSNVGSGRSQTIKVTFNGRY